MKQWELNQFRADMKETIHGRESFCMFSEVSIREEYRLLSHSLSSCVQLINEAIMKLMSLLI